MVANKGLTYDTQHIMWATCQHSGVQKPDPVRPTVWQPGTAFLVAVACFTTMGLLVVATWQYTAVLHRFECVWEGAVGLEALALQMRMVGLHLLLYFIIIKHVSVLAWPSSCKDRHVLFASTLQSQLGGGGGGGFADTCAFLRPGFGVYF